MRTAARAPLPIELPSPTPRSCDRVVATVDEAGIWIGLASGTRCFHRTAREIDTAPWVRTQLTGLRSALPATCPSSFEVSATPDGRVGELYQLRDIAKAVGFDRIANVAPENASIHFIDQLTDDTRSCID